MRLDRPARGDRELVRGRHATASTSSPTRRMYKFRAGADLRPRTIWRARLPQHRHAEAGPDQRRLGHDADAHRGLRPGHAGASRPRTWRSPTTPTRWTSSSTARGRPARARAAARRLRGARLRARARARPRTRSISVGRSLYRREQLRLRPREVQRRHRRRASRSAATAASSARRGSPASTSTGPARGAARCGTNDTVRAPSVVPKGDARNGLVYTFENVKDPRVADADPWYWTALDARTGRGRVEAARRLRRRSTTTTTPGSRSAAPRAPGG